MENPSLRYRLVEIPTLISTELLRFYFSFLIRCFEFGIWNFILIHLDFLAIEDAKYIVSPYFHYGAIPGRDRN